MNETQQRLIERHLDLIIEANKITNLTRIDSVEDGMLLHVEDSLSGLQEIQAAPEGLYGDLGTGGGFPGIPLAIATGRQTILADSVGKKTKVLDGVIEDLGLSDHVSTYHGRIEDLAVDHRFAFSVLTARALSQLSILMELASPCLKMGGQLICYKANVSEEELEHARELEKKLGMKIVSDRSFTLSDGQTNRRIIVFEKFAKPKLSLPRKVGFAQKKPL
ncbi:MAG: 16S rRNA (guanine(527)-N(7))-methyltransferase RsmG [Coriobacteriia bacterium]|nr:16S rRNA (guanine(527)-N(7))-methyltransferase RsmG [Coriobacteriia bacterium]